MRPTRRGLTLGRRGYRRSMSTTDLPTPAATDLPTPAAPAGPRAEPWPTRLAMRIEQWPSADHVSELLAPLARPLAATAVGALARDRAIGHALHPALTMAPAGMWLGAAVLDLGAGDRHSAQRFEALGLLAALPAAVTGLAEWTQTSGGARRVGSSHAALNTVAVTLHAVSWFARRSGHHTLGATTSTLGNVVVSASAFLGGHLATSLKVGSATPRADAQTAAAQT